MGRPIFRHVVLFRFQPGTTESQVASLVRAAAALPAQVPQIRAYRFGADALETPGNFDFAIVADFDDVTDWRAYVAHPAHQAFVAEHVRPILSERAAVQFRIEAP